MLPPARQTTVGCRISGSRAVANPQDPCGAPCRRRTAQLHSGCITPAGWMLFPMIELLQFISYLITLYTYVIIAGVILSWLISFNVINGYNPFVRSLWQGVSAVTEPVLAPIRRMLPNMGGIDISPIVLLLGCWFVQLVVLPNIAKLFL